ncbi:MAG: hypothetical protein AAF655_01770 [Bacteroidota bacterium]
MAHTIGIRREDLDKKGEQRVAISPEIAAEIHRNGAKLLIQPGIHPDTRENKRAFPDQAYEEEGATVAEDLSPSDIIVGLKEVKKTDLIPEKTYLFFSHTHKGQIKNRSLLKALIEKKNTLIDYELVTDPQNRRLITAFTYFAGYAGMTDSLWTYGKRMGASHPFHQVPQAIDSGGMQAVKSLMREIGQQIEAEGTPADLPPFICCFLGAGKTSTGSQEIFDLLPVESITLDQLVHTYEHGDRKKVYKLVLDIPQMYRFKEDSSYKGKEMTDQEVFSLYLKEPENFESNLDQVFPYVSMVLNCIIWSSQYPRLLSREDTKAWYAQHKTLQVIGDITCDPEGAIHFSKETWIDNPVYIYDPASKESIDGFEGEGIAVMAVTNLPCEFPADASTQFSKELAPLFTKLLEADLSADDIAEAGLPPALRKATILWKGKFTEPYAYMEEYVK